MPLPASGAISFNNINVELGLTATAQISMNDSAVRTLFGVASGAISMNQGYGKASSFTFNKTISTNTQTYNLRTDALAAGWNGVVVLNATITINNGVYVWSDDTAIAGFDTGSIPAGSTISITNNGFIIGRGGGIGTFNNQAGLPGGPAMNISCPVSITNNSFIAGGGGSGGGGGPGYGGGAGGGIGGGGNSTGSPGGPGGAGGAPGSAGGNAPAGTNYGGGGGRVLPGTGAAAVSASRGGTAGSTHTPGLGGGAGGSGGATAGINSTVTSGSGGASNLTGSNATGSTSQGGFSGAGGGGGWGAIGSGSVAPLTLTTNSSLPGGAGGKAVNLNGNTATFIVTGTRYGAIS